MIQHVKAKAVSRVATLGRVAVSDKKRGGDIYHIGESGLPARCWMEIHPLEGTGHKAFLCKLIFAVG
jgi:hypothetical protein